MIESVKKRLDDRPFIGVIEDTMDPKRMGRVKVRIDQIFGRKDEAEYIKTEDLPWCSPTMDMAGGAFMTASVGKVVSVSFVEGDLYRPVYDQSLHLNYNLQQKLLSLSPDEYADFYAVAFDDLHQYYVCKTEGAVFDYQKSKLNIQNNGNIVLGLRDNDSFLMLGTEDASEPAILGNHFMQFMDRFIAVILGVKGGPYIGNLGADVLPSPALLEICNEYLANRPAYLSENVMIADNKCIKPLERGYDKQIKGDKFNNESSLIALPENEALGYKPSERFPSSDVPTTSYPSLYSENLSSSILPSNPTNDESERLQPPSGLGFGNGLIPLTSMKKSKYTSASFNDERAYLIPAAAAALDAMLDAYHTQKPGNQSNVVVTKSYQSKTRQFYLKTRYPHAPIEGKDPFGWGNQVELYWGVRPINGEALRAIIDRNVEPLMTNELTLRWLLDNSKKYNWRLVGRNEFGESQWWHWIYDTSL